jgi:serine/threonine-protein kinase
MSGHPATLSSYSVERELGRGGMGVVYLARDPRLGRHVAIKLLSAAFARDPEHLARFEREAKLLASLNHPNIATIYGVERVPDDATGGIAGQPLLVLEYVPGDTLAARLRRGALPVEEALEYCRQIALAVEAAHDRGVIHRDLKPGNVTITPAGQVKVLDFGLAKGDTTESADLALSPTFTYVPTAAGVVLGTAAYMSPEQARGRPVDKRSDIWSFGCVLYECLTGRRPFDADTVSDTIARILEREVDWSVLPAATSAPIRDLLRRCLEKDVRKRQRDIGDVRLEIEEALALRASSSAAMTGLAPTSPTSRSTSWRTAAIGVALLMLGAAAGIGVWTWLARGGAAGSAPGPLRLSVSVPETIRAIDVRLSRDGKRFFILGFGRRSDGTEEVAPRLYTRLLTEREDALRAIPGTEGTQGFTLSTDGTWIAALGWITQTSQRHLFKVRSDGSGQPVSLHDWDEQAAPQFAWLPDDDLLLTVKSPDGWNFVRVPTGTAGPRSPVRLDTGSTRIGYPHLATPPLDDRSVFVEVDTWGSKGFQPELWLADVVTGKASKILDRAGRAKYLPTGHLAFTRGSTLMAAPFDLATRTVTGDVIDLEGGLWAPNSWAHATFGLAANGTLFFGSGGQQGADRRLVIVDSSGSIAEAADRREFESSLSLSPTARRASVVIPNLKGTFETWVADLDRGGNLQKVCALANADCADAVWSPGGDQLAFSRVRADDDDGIWIQPLNGAPPLPLHKARYLQDPPLFPSSWGRGGLIVVRGDPGDNDLLFLPVPPSGEPGPLRDLRVTPHDETEARLSPDGRLLAYRSDE